MSTPRLSRSEAKARTREQLLDAARHVFEAEGFYGATVEAIVARAGFTRGAFYANWADKAEPLWELIERSNAERFEAMAADVSAAPVEEQMQVVQAWFESTLGNWPLGRARAELNASLQDSDKDRERLAHALAAERRIIVRLLEAIAATLGVTFPIPMEHFAAMGLALGYGLSQQHQADPDAIPASLFAAAQAYLWVGALAAQSVPEIVDYGLNVKTDVGEPTTGEHA